MEVGAGVVVSKWDTPYRAGTAYLQVVPGKGHYELKVVKATQRKPAVTEQDAVVVKVELRVPRRAFLPLEPTAVVTVPEELVQHVIEAEAVDET